MPAAASAATAFRAASSSARTARRSSSPCCRTRPPSTSRANAPTARCANSTTGSTSAPSAWCCSTKAACCCAPIRPSTHLAGSVPVSLADGAPELARLLSWEEGGALQSLRRARGRSSRRAGSARPGRPRRLRAIVRCYRTAGGQAPLHGDRRGPQRRGGARPGAHADRRDDGHGQRRHRHLRGVVGLGAPAAQTGGAGGPSSSLLQNISRDIVAPESLAEYERLQLALSARSAPRCATASSIPSSASAGC